MIVCPQTHIYYMDVHISIQIIFEYVNTTFSNSTLPPC